jgi:hypothetical protein
MTLITLMVSMDHAILVKQIKFHVQHRNPPKAW